MKKAILLLSIILGFTMQSQAQYDKNFAIGFKVGEPLGLNIRKYFRQGDRAFDVNFGTYGFIYGRDRKYRKGNYDQSGLMLQGLYNYHTTLGKKGGVKAYFGYGGQINFRKYVSKQDLIGTRQNGDKHISLGPAGNAGLEYEVPGNNLGVFLDAGLYAEILQDPLFLHPQINAGIRVNLVK